MIFENTLNQISTQKKMITASLKKITVDLGNYDNVLPPICYNSNSNGNLLEEIK